MLNIKKINLKETLIPTIILLLIFVIILNPKAYISSTANGIAVWATVVLPSLLPFFFLTKLLINFKMVYRVSGFFSFITKKFYNCPSISSYIFFMSVISGYPVGAKLISEFHKNGSIDDGEAHRLISFCSTSGPMFIIGSIGASLFLDKTAGIIIFISHILSSLLNGIIYRKYKFTKGNLALPKIKSDEVVLSECMYNTIISVLTVGGFIAISFTAIEIMLNLNLFKPFEFIVDFLLKPFNLSVGKELFTGIIEVTRGCVDIANLGLKPALFIPIVTGLVSFGGLSIHLQSYTFLQDCKIKYKFFLLTKITHTVLSVCVSLIFVFLIY